MLQWLNICLIFEGFSTVPQGNVEESEKPIQKFLGLGLFIHFIHSFIYLMFIACLFCTTAMYVCCRFMHKSCDYWMIKQQPKIKD